MPSAVPSAAAFQYGPTMFVPPGAQGPASGKQHGMGLGLGNPSASPFQQQSQQQPSGYGQHTFSSGQQPDARRTADGSDSFLKTIEMVENVSFFINYQLKI